MKKVLGRNFYEQEAPIVAKKILGAYLAHNSPEGLTVGKIVETEAYLGVNDPASHSFRGQTKRNYLMFGPAGQAYIYYVYGMYYCFNVVTGKEGSGEAVLIRALEPIEGIPLMMKRRKNNIISKLTNGPAKLVQAMGITKAFNGSDLTTGPIRIYQPKNNGQLNELSTCSKERGFEFLSLDNKIGISERIGISKGKDLLLRFYIKGNNYCSTPY